MQTKTSFLATVSTAFLGLLLAGCSAAGSYQGEYQAFGDQSSDGYYTTPEPKVADYFSGDEARPANSGSDRVFEGPGYTMKYPAGWSIRETAENRIQIESQKGRFILTSMMFPGVKAGEITYFMVQNCTGSAIDPARFQWANKFSLQASHEMNGHVETSGVMVQETQNGLTMMCGTMNASKGDYVAFSDEANRVLQTMQPVQGTAASGNNGGYQRTSAPKTDWTNAPMVTMRDPEEGSFTVDIPQGWNFKGGTGRVHTMQVRQWLMTSSPDNEIVIIYGDPEVPQFLVPNPYMGMQEGTWHHTQFTGSYMVRNYTPGLQFAQERAKELFGNQENFKFTIQKDGTEEQRRVAMQGGASWANNVTNGFSNFEFTQNGVKMLGMYMATTIFDPNVGSWALLTALRVVAPESRRDEAEAISKKIFMKPDANWNAQQQAGAARNQQQMTQYFSETSKMLNESHKARMSAMDASHDAYMAKSRASDSGHRDFIDAIREVQQVRDPETGKQYEMQYGSLSYWIDKNENKVGVNSYENPHPWYFRELLQIKN